MNGAFARTSYSVMDVAAISASVGVVVQVLAPVAALLSIIWLAIRIYEYIRWRRGGRQEEGRPPE
ncbi:MAG: hypothetical protein ABIF09_14495 [Gemmatimonadota bacterium]